MNQLLHQECDEFRETSLRGLMFGTQGVKGLVATLTKGFPFKRGVDG